MKETNLTKLELFHYRAQEGMESGWSGLLVLAPVLAYIVMDQFVSVYIFGLWIVPAWFVIYAVIGSLFAGALYLTFGLFYARDHVVRRESIGEFLESINYVDPNPPKRGLTLVRGLK